MAPPYQPARTAGMDPRDVYNELAHKAMMAYDAYRAAVDRGDDAAAEKALAEHNAYFMAAAVVEPMAKS